MKSKHLLLHKIISVLISFAIVLPGSLALIGNSGSAYALTSLPYIEQFKQNGGAFNILEIVPAAGQGSIGYYIDGQEPCANWATNTAALTSPTARKTYVNNTVFGNLTSAGLLGAVSDTTKPLTKTADYDEAYPWQTHTNLTKTMTLNQMESSTVNGTFSLADNGTYTQSNDITYIGGSGGSYVQVIDHFSASSADQDSGNRYYYSPTFAPIPDTSNVAAQTAVYSLTGGVYVYVGTVGDTDFPGMEIGETYYYVSNYGTPSPTVTSTFPYVAVSYSYRAVSAGPGYFNATNIRYTYVGTGGTYNFVAGGTTSNTIWCNLVYYAGGFTNNNWFLKYVLDWSPENNETKPAINFRVKSVLASDVTESLVEDWASMVVLSNGFVPGGTATQYSASNDISTEVSSAIAGAVAKSGSADTNYNLPVIVDYRLLDSTNNPAQRLNALATSLKPASTTIFVNGIGSGFVSSSVFFFNPDTTRTDLATKEFCKYYGSSNYSVAGSAFYAAYQEIVYENFLRTTANAGAVTLGVDINMARAIRYILNFAGQRIITPKTTVNVLEVQPGSGQQLTPAIVKPWLGYASDSSAINVIIDAMSTAELIGKIDVISEKYDIVYIGSNVQGFNPTNANTTNYNDSTNMNGLIYSNIGDTVVMNGSASSGYSMSGLLDRDYSASTFTSGGTAYNKLNTSSTAATTTKTFRYSGNDITATKMQELQDFINSGFPVIIENTLITGSRHAATGALVISAAATYNSSAGYLTVNAAETSNNAIPSYYTPSYSWYSTGSTTVLSTNQNYTPTGVGNYYCTISYTLGTIPTTYTAKSNTVSVTAKTVYTATPSGTATAGQYLTGGSTVYTLKLSQTGWPYFNVSVTPQTYNSIDYQWYGNTSSFTTGGTKVGTDSPNFTDSMSYPYTYYRCQVTIDGTAATTSSLYYYYNNTSVSSTATIVNIASFSLNITPVINTANVTLTASAAPNTAAALQWYVKGNSNNYSTYSTAASITVASGTYYCKTTGQTTNAQSLTYTISSSQSGFNYTANPPGTFATLAYIKAQSTADFAINTATVDINSYMFSLLSPNVSKPNVMVQSDLTAQENIDALKQYVTLSKPIINWYTSDPNISPYPKDYSNNNGVIASLLPKSDGSYYLEYYFSIENDTDTDPANTRYTCNLYVDANGDGRYGSSELLADTLVREWNSTTNTAGSIVSSSALKAGVQYYVSRRMPSDKYGITPWKLEIVKSGTGNSGTHTSIHKYTYIPTATGSQVKLDILQINADDANGLSLAAQMATVTGGSFHSDVTGLYYAGIYGKLLADISKDFNISITTVQTPNIVAMPSGGWKHGTTTYTALLDYLKSYNMLIIGFRDVYGTLDQPSAQAIKAYILTGRAVLFTHDNTSFYNLPFSDYLTTSNQKVASGWGYNFNMNIRDTVGLDRYGVTNSTYGISQYAPSGITRATGWSSAGWTAKSYSGATAANLSTLINAGYSVAYMPKSSPAATVPETQGFTRGLLDRFKGTTDNFQTTNTVSQVNEGQITTYPYNVNTAGFLSDTSTTNSMTVALTHFQYYQLNMNSPDTVVWYCLKYANSSLGLDNDAANSYYIYSKGNVTYSGAGHTSDAATVNDPKYLSEAELFVNTMVAAYRVTQVAPDIHFSDISGKNILTNYLIPSDVNASGNAVALTPTTPSSTDTSRNIYFLINDTNIGSNKVITASFSYGPTSAPTSLTNVPVYSSETNTVVPSTTSLVSGITYYIRLDDPNLQLPDIGNGIQLNITVTTTISGNTFSKSASLTLNKLMLFSLS